METCLIFCVYLKTSMTRKNQIKLTLIRVASKKKTKQNKKEKKCCKDVECKTLRCFWWECRIVLSLQKTVWKSLKKIKNKIELLYDPALPLLGRYPKEVKKKKKGRDA